MQPLETLGISQIFEPHNIINTQQKIHMPNIWIFSNNRKGHYEDSDWDTSTILKTKNYYFKESEPNRQNVKKGDTVLFREYGFGFWKK